MESNKEEMDLAERKISEEDYNGAKKFLDKARILYPKLDGLKQVSMIINVYISAKGEPDWYGILCLDPSDDEEAVKKQYKSLALLLHPDKNRFLGAEGAFKLVLDACSLLSDKDKRISYDQKRKLKQVIQKKKSDTAYDKAKAAKQAQERAKRWFEESREKFAPTISAYDTKNQTQEEVKRWFEESRIKAAAAAANEAERIFKKPMKTETTSSNFTFEARRIFKKPMKTATRSENSTSEAERLFKKPMMA